MKRALLSCLVILLAVGYLAAADDRWPETSGGGGGGPGSDTTAIHDNTANEINAISQDLTPDATDYLIGEDGVSGAKESYQIQDLPTGAGADNVEIDGVAATNPDFRSEGDIDTIRCTGPGAPDLSCPAIEDVIYRYNANSIESGDFAAGAVDGQDTTAIHDNVDAEISAIATEQTAPVEGDWLLLEDSAGTNAKRKVQVTNLTSGLTNMGSVGGVPYGSTMRGNSAAYTAQGQCKPMGNYNNACAAASCATQCTEGSVPFSGGAVKVNIVCHRAFTTGCAGGETSTFRVHEFTGLATDVGVVSGTSVTIDCNVNYASSGTGTTTNTEGFLQIEKVNTSDSSPFQTPVGTCQMFLH